MGCGLRKSGSDEKATLGTPAPGMRLAEDMRAAETELAAETGVLGAAEPRPELMDAEAAEGGQEAV